MYAGHIPSLVAHLDFPEWTLLPVKAVPGPFLLDKLPGLGIFDSCSLPEPLAFTFPALYLARWPSLWQGARAPGTNPETVHALRTCARPRFTGLELSKVGADSASKKWRNQDTTDPIPEACSTRFGAGCPWRILGNHAILGARDQTCLLQARFGLKVLTDGILCWSPVWLEYAAHLPGLNALFASTACERPWGPKGPCWHWHALIPGTQLPVIKVLVPVTHTETVSLVGGTLALVTVGVKCRPAVHMGAPDCPALAATWATVAAHTSSPWTWETVNRLKLQYETYCMKQ